MAVKTSTATGDWSAGGTWVGGVAPANGDSFVIASGHTVTFDVDQSAMGTGMIAGTVTGTLALTTTPGTYVLKMDGVSGHDITIGAAGKIDWGTRAAPIAADVKATINLGSASRVTNSAAGWTCNLWSTWPTTYRKTLTTGTNSAAATSITVADTWANLSADQWAVGDVLCICKRQITGALYEFVTIAAGSAGSTINISSGLVNTYGVDSWVVRVTSNVMVTGSGSPSSAQFYGVSRVPTACSLGCTFYKTGSQASTAISQLNSTSADIGGAFFNYNIAISDINTVGGCNGLYLVGNNQACGYFGASIDYVTIIAATQAFAASCSMIHVGKNCYIGGGGSVFGTMDGSFSGVVESCTSFIKYGTTIASCCTIRREAKIGGSGTAANGVDIQPGHPRTIVGYGAGLFSASQVQNYLVPDPIPHGGVILWDYAAVYDTPQPGYIRAWLRSGRIITITSGYTASPPITSSYWYQSICETATGPLVFDIPLFGQIGVPIQVTIWAAKTVNSMTTTPRFSLANPQYQYGHASANFTSVTMADDLLWQTIVLSYTPVTTGPLVLRMAAAHSSASIYWNYRVDMAYAKLGAGMRGGFNG